MRTLIFATLVAALGALLAERSNAQTMQFPANRDTNMQSHETEQFSNEGAVSAIRVWKGNQEAALIDFDTDAMGTFIANNPGILKWTLNITMADNAGGPLSDVPVLTVESTNDWVEGDGAGANYGWTAGTAAATYFYAQSRYSGTPPQADTANSLYWNDPDSGVYHFTRRTPDPVTYGIPGLDPVANPNANPTPEFTNSQSFAVGDLTAGNTASVVIDADIINALVNDVNNRGLRLAPIENGGGIENARMYTREDGQGRGAYLEVTVIPEPASILLLLGSVCCLGLRRR